jgi:hypothetical protein
MSSRPFERKWLIGAASELADARKWLMDNLPEAGWHLELLASRKTLRHLGAPALRSGAPSPIRRMRESVNRHGIRTPFSG